MTLSVDLNADMGESFGAWRMGQDAAMLDIVTSANIACGFHAGDPLVMAQTVRAALERGVAIGAHPGFPDLQGFGRRRMQIDSDSLGAMIRYQIGALAGIARAEGGEVAHVKLHGALSNMACEDETLAETCFRAAVSMDPDLVIYALPGTAMERAAEKIGCRWVAEVFADRAYNRDLTLVDRRRPGAMIDDERIAADRMARMVADGVVETVDGATVPVKIDTVCVHGDTPGALKIAAAVRDGIRDRGIALRAP